MNSIDIHYAFLPHLDGEASLAFYRDALGFEVRQDVGGGPMRWLTVAPVGSATAIVLHPPVVDPGVSDAERQTVLDLMAKGSLTAITFATDDLDALFERLVAAGVDVVSEPADQDYGVRDAAVRDPAGNLVRINQK